MWRGRPRPRQARSSVLVPQDPFVFNLLVNGLMRS
jgi:hypothetical protein